MSTTPSQIPAALARKIADRIDGATLTIQALPDCPDLKLYLLDESYPQWQLSGSQAAALMDNPPYWSFCWASGQALARFIKENPTLVKNRRVADFGAGSGVVAIAALQAGAKLAVACDSDATARIACQSNAELNGYQLPCVADPDQLDNTLDVITVADVFYDRDNLDLLAKLQSKCKTLLIADSRLGGRDLPGMTVTEKISSHTVPDLDESSEFRNVCIYINEPSAQL